MDENFATVFSCNDWTTACGGSEVITITTCGKYFLQVHTYADWSTTICDIFEEVYIETGCGNGNGTGSGIFPVLSIGDVVVNEADGTASLTVSLDQPTTGDVTVDYGTDDNGTIAGVDYGALNGVITIPCLLYTSPSPRDATLSRMPSSA